MFAIQLSFPLRFSSLHHEHNIKVFTQLLSTFTTPTQRLCYIYTTSIPLLLRKMPLKWDAANSMQMLLLVIAEADVKPTTTVWNRVAQKLGDTTPSAVRYEQGARFQLFACPNFLYLWIELYFSRSLS